MLYFIPTPIGNLEDMTVRSLRILHEIEVVLCEDSRKTRKLLNLLQITKKFQFVDLNRHHKLNHTQIEKILEKSKVEKFKLALMTDSGLAGISDPGREVVEICQSKNIPYTVLPGASSLVTAVVSSGLVYKEFIFLGFLPIKKGRNKKWSEVKMATYPIVIFESVHRIDKFLNEAKIYLHPKSKICICKDLTKMYEDVWSGLIEDIQELNLTRKGEFVIVIQNVITT